MEAKEDQSQALPRTLWDEGHQEAAKYWYNYYKIQEQKLTTSDLSPGHSGHHGPPSMAPPETPTREMSKYLHDYKCNEVPEDAHHLATKVDWEKSVIWDAEDVKLSENRTSFSEWDLSTGKRMVPSLKNQSSLSSGGRTVDAQQNHEAAAVDERQNQVDEGNNLTKALAHIDNPKEAVQGRWEDKIIWDAEDIRSKYMAPKVPDYNANLVSLMPKDTEESQGPSGETENLSELLEKLQCIRGIQPQPAAELPNNFYNISNDEHYQSKVELIQQQQSQNLCHSVPILEFKYPFISTRFTDKHLRQFHRPSFRLDPGKYDIFSCEGLIRKLKHSRAEMIKTILAMNPLATEEELCLMHSDIDLTGKDGELLLVENCEEHPPFLSQVGMCSKIKNYRKQTGTLKQATTVAHSQCHPYGELANVQASTFLGSLRPDQMVSVLENNMYLSPIYQHGNTATDFVLIINRRDIVSIRSYDALFTAGQQCPLIEVPPPESSKAKRILQNMAMLQIYRMLYKSQNLHPRPSVPFNGIQEALPTVNPSTLRKWASQDCNLLSIDGVCWVALKEGHLLPSETVLRRMVTPEEYCAYVSLLAGEQRLKDLGYLSKMSTMLEDESEEERSTLLDDEVKAAPWNTTAAFVGAMKGKWLLQVAGPADPSGCGEGFSYVRAPKKGIVLKGQKLAKPRRRGSVNDAALRRLSTQDAKDVLKGFGMSEEEIKKLNRWEIIDLVRTILSEKEKAGEAQAEMTTFCPSNLNTLAFVSNHEGYKRECQRVFDLQNKVLSSSEVLTSDDESDSDDRDEDLEKMGKCIENMLGSESKATSSSESRDLEFEQEEKERLELMKMLFGEKSKEKSNAERPKEQPESNGKTCGETKDFGFKWTPRPGCKLKISRSHYDSNGELITEVETVNHPAVIQGYLQLRNNKDAAFLLSVGEKESKKLKAELARKRKLEKEEFAASLEKEKAAFERRAKKMKEEIDTEYFPTKSSRNKALAALKFSRFKAKPTRARRPSD